MRQGRGHGVHYLCEPDAVTQNLSAARATGGYERKLVALSGMQLLIVDDFAHRLKPLRPPVDEDLHDLIAQRYER